MKFDRERLRLILLGVFFWMVLGAFTLRLVQIQIVDGADYLARQQRGSSKVQTIKAARGEILDRNGDPFSYNIPCYNVLFDRALTSTDGDNETIFNLILLLRQSGETWIDNLPLVIQDGAASFTDDATAVNRLREHLETNTYAQASDVFYWMCERYRLTPPADPNTEWFTALSESERRWIETLSVQDARDIGAVRYEMERKGYSLSNRYTFAEDISLETAIRIQQTGPDLPGVDVVETARRGYRDGELAPHIIGRVGAIFADELEGYLNQNKGYTREDQVGKEGIERTFESTLRGTDGTRRIDLDASYKVIGIEEERPAIPGNTVVLTIDKDIQRAAAKALEEQIKYLNETAPAGEGKEANAGAVVAIDIKNSEVLAAITYPSYNLETYSADYAANAANPLYPFLNRAFSGVYAPGSCFKPVTGIAGLAEGVIKPDTRVDCQHTYSFYAPGYQPTCLGWHGLFTVTDALRHSCNVFFYDTGRLLGIAKINEYARALGLGSPTGIELSEANGTQCDPNTVFPGDALQAAIGQLDNGYSPVQLANYCATIARRGVRTRLHLVKSISSYYDWQDVIEKPAPEVLSDLGLPDSLYDPIFEGMIQATHDPRGTAYSRLGNYPITVASKTGTPQTHEFPNSTFICFAPAEDPQIAIAVVIEKGWHGYTGAPVARKVLDAYFFPEASADSSASSESSDNLAPQNDPSAAEPEPQVADVAPAAPGASPESTTSR